jgi:hypothetical protein
VVVLRIRLPEAPRSFRLPGGPLLPLVSALVSVALLVVARPGGQELTVAAGVLAVGFCVWGMTVWSQRRLARNAAEPE